MTELRYEKTKTITTKITDIAFIINIIFLARYFIMDKTVDSLFAYVMIPLIIIQIICVLIKNIADVRFAYLMEKEENHG